MPEIKDHQCDKLDKHHKSHKKIGCDVIRKTNEKHCNQAPEQERHKYIPCNFCNHSKKQ